MRTVIKLSTLVSLVTIMTAGLSTTVKAQSKKDEQKAAIRQLVTDRNYIFVAQTVTPMSGRVRQLNFDYDLRVRKDSVVAYLPYFGRAYSAPIDPSDAAIQFTSTDFQYSETPTKKGGWDILIKPNDAKEVQQMFLSILENGSASLRVTSNNRQAVLFNGFITNKNGKN